MQLWVYSIVVSNCMSKITDIQPPCASLSSCDLGVQVHLETCSIMASKYISQESQSLRPSAYLSISDPSFQVPLQIDPISTCNCMSKRSWSPPPSSVSNGSEPSLWVWVRVQTEMFSNWPSGSSWNPNHPLGYSSMVKSQPIRIGPVVSGSPSGSSYRFIYGSCICSLLIVSNQNRVVSNR